MLSRLKFEFDDLVNQILDQLPEKVWDGKHTFLDPAMGGGQFVKEIERRLIEKGHNPSELVFGWEWHQRSIRYAIKRHGLLGKYSVGNVNTEEDMKFDVIVGNPPYQDGSKEGGQNKIYNLFSKKALDLVKPNGFVGFITPTSVLKKSKRFSLIGQKGLKAVNFLANESFDVGVKICYWIVAGNYEGKVSVTDKTGTREEDNETTLYDLSEVDVSFAKIYETLKSMMDKPEKRMFRENNFGDAASKTQDNEFIHPIFSIKDGKKEIFSYSKRVPFFQGKKKIIVPMTKTVSDDSILVDTDDFYVAYLCTEIEDDKEIENIKSFILSPYFQEHSKQWKQLDGYGFNYALKYLPPFDKTKTWTNDEVKEFIESFVND